MIASMSRWMLRISGDWVTLRRRTREPASSITSMALSGKNAVGDVAIGLGRTAVLSDGLVCERTPCGSIS